VASTTRAPGLRSIEHNTSVHMSSDPRAPELRKQNAAATPDPGVGFVIQNLRRRSQARFDEQTAQPLFAKFRANDTWLVPTLVQGLVWQYLADGTLNVALGIPFDPNALFLGEVAEGPPPVPVTA
jgi:hypothetical protein